MARTYTAHSVSLRRWTLGQCRPVLAVTVNRFRFREANRVKVIGGCLHGPAGNSQRHPVVGGVGNNVMAAHAHPFQSTKVPFGKPPPSNLPAGKIWSPYLCRRAFPRPE